MMEFKRAKNISGISALFVLAFALVISFGGDRLSAALEGTDSDDLRTQLMSAPLTAKLGGDTTVDTTGPRAFRSIAANADNSLMNPFLFGQRIFDIVWDHDPVISPVLDGLGPMFNRTSCRECHEGNGRGQPPGVCRCPDEVDADTAQHSGSRSAWWPESDTQLWRSIAGPCRRRRGA